MRFSVDAHAIGQHLTGNETYIRNLLQCYAKLDEEAEFITYVSRAAAFPLVPSRFEKRMVAENPFRRLGYDLARRLREDAPDLIHVQYTAPIKCPVPVVVSVHDVSFLEHPEFFTRFRALQLKHTVKRTVNLAERVLTPSEFSKRSIISAYGVPEEKVKVTPNGVSPGFRPIGRENARRWLQTRYGYQFPTILTLGDVQPRKNHLRLIEAFEELLHAHPSFPHHLVIAGKETWHSPVVRARTAKSPFSSRIHFTGFVEDDELLRLYGACDLFVYPSLYEGFGIPILEAMACGRAVACSNTSAMEEVADSAALLFDPHSTEQIMRAMRDLLLDSELRQRMERLGMQRAAAFSWERTARETLDTYYEVAGLRPSKTTALRRSASLVRS